MNEKIKNIFNIELRIRINKYLYEKKIINYEIFEKMENNLILELKRY